MITKLSIFAVALATVAACTQVPTTTQPAVQQLDAAKLWSTGSYR